MASEESQRLIDQVRGGDSAAATELFDRYVLRLLALVRSHLSRKLSARVDPDDVVQSAYRSFFRRVASDDIVLQRAGDLWRLLAAFAINKLRSQIEFHSAQSRKIDREASASELQDLRQIEQSNIEPTAEQAMMIADELDAIVSALQPRERAVLVGRLQGHTVGQIATELNCSQRTVRRVLGRCQKVAERRLLEDADTAERTV